MNYFSTALTAKKNTAELKPLSATLAPSPFPHRDKPSFSNRCLKSASGLVYFTIVRQSSAFVAILAMVPAVKPAMEVHSIESCP